MGGIELKGMKEAYAVKMYGDWIVFDVRRKALDWAFDGATSTEGSEQDRYYMFIISILNGEHVCDTDC